MKKILFVISTLNTGGAQRAFANMSLGLPEGWGADFLLNDDQNISYDYRGNIISLGVAPQADKTKLSYQLRVFLRRIFRLRQLKATGEYVACISGLASANAVNILTGNKFCKTIVSFRIFMSKVVTGDGIKGWIKRVTTKWLANRADHVVAVSERMRLDLIDNFNVHPDKVVTIYNGYPLEEIDRLTREPLDAQQMEWFANANQMIVTVGRLDEQKDHATLIKAFAKVRNDYPYVRLLILGEGEKRQELQGMINQLGMEENVILCGFQENPYKIVARCDAFVLSSLYEGFPNTLAESLCIGIPAISTDCDSGAREILAPDTDVLHKIDDQISLEKYGILCPVGDVDRMAEALLTLLGDGKLLVEYRGKSRERSRQLSINQMMLRWIELVES